ncbi:hypothetical protein HYV10_03935 [Candidatus Dependentiae bacterium]|nr:hypothetical protein [Candidatus Dependentiae bacterium]
MLVHNLIFLRLSMDAAIAFVSQTADLSSVTCCDAIDLVFNTEKQKYNVSLALRGVQLFAFKQDLENLIAAGQSKLALQNSLYIFRSELGQFLIEISDNNKPLAYYLVSLDTLEAWIKQLNLLQILMQENENEKKARNSSCCG